jgi:RHS repeat-associated protein
MMMLMSSVTVQAHTLTYTTFTSKANHLIGKKIALSDPMGDVTIKGGRKAIAKLTYGRESQTDVLNKAWSYRVTYDLSQEGRTGLLVDDGVMTIYSQDGGSIYDAAQVTLLDMPTGLIKAKVELTIVKIEAAATSTGAYTTDVSLIPLDVRIELCMEVERYDDIGGATTTEHQYLDAEKTSHTAKIQWDYLPGAESYELEWIYVDDKVNSPIMVTEELFAGATRVEISQNLYDLSVTYPSGKLYYRVRGVGRYLDATAVGTDYTHIQYSEWSSLCTAVITVDPFSDQAIWTTVSSYAEEGKYKKVVQYYDDALKSRQSLTNLSTEKITIAGSTLYDVEGRASVNVLPSPVIGDNTLRYKSILRNYKRYQFDKSAGADALGTTVEDGSGNYFSAALSTSATIMYRSFIADAGGYPMVQTQFLNDGTGRIAAQSGVGAAYKIGSQHETRYYYNSPSSTQLRRLFGKNVGESKYYKQTIVLDANGQASASYSDPTGKVIATSMLGNSPSNVLPINSSTPIVLTESLNDLNRLNTEGGNSTLTHSVFNLAENGGNNHRIDYTVTQLPVSQVCPTCNYRLIVRVESPENGGVGAITPIGTIPNSFIVNKSSNNQEFSIEEELSATTICTGISRSYELKFEKTGTYKITKELILIRPSAADLRDKIYTDNKAFWDGQLATITTTYLKKVNPLECAQSCEEYARLFIDKNYPINIINPNDPINTQRYIIYGNKILECEQKAIDADNATSTEDCDNLRDQLLDQMMPGGCVYEDAAKWESWIGAVNFTTRKGLIGSYTDLRAYLIELDGDRDPLIETILVEKHKEYGHHLWCIKTKELNDFGTKLVKMRLVDLGVGNEFNLSTISDINNATAVQNWFIDLINTKDAARAVFTADGKDFATNLLGKLSALTWRSDECLVNQTFYNFIQCGGLSNTTTVEAKEEKWRKMIMLYLGAREKTINELRTSYGASSVFNTCWQPKTDQCVIVQDFRSIYGVSGQTGIDQWKNDNKDLGGVLFEEDCITRFNRQLDGYLTDLKKSFPAKAAIIDDVNGAIQTALRAYRDYTCAQTNPANPYGFILDADIVGNVPTAVAIQTALNNNGMGTWIVKDRWSKVWGDVYVNDPFYALNACGEALKTKTYSDFVNNGFSLPSCNSNGNTDIYKYSYFWADATTGNPFPSLGCGGQIAAVACAGYGHNGIPPNSGGCKCFKIIGIFRNGSTTPNGFIMGERTDGLTPKYADIEVTSLQNLQVDPVTGALRFGSSLEYQITLFNILSLIETRYKVRLKTEVLAQEQYETAQKLYDNCISQQEEYYKSLAYESWREQLDAAVAAKINEYSRNCVANTRENITLTRPDKEYHFTLYYYDQSGSLLQTVPPEGVAVLPIQLPYFDSNGKWIYTNTDDIPVHTLRTRYIYNSLGQVLRQTTPDGGKTEYVYDYAQRMRFSQNAKQKTLLDGNDYSYTKYDDLGRVIEVGKIDNPTTNTFAAAQSSDVTANTIEFPLVTDGVLKEVTSTTYSGITSTNGIVQNNTRNRVSSVKTRNLNSATDDIVTHYDYDEHGNVKALYHNITALNRTVKTEYKYDLISNKVTEVAYQRGQIDQYYHRYQYDADNRITSVYTSLNGLMWERDARYFYYLHGSMARTELGQDKVQGTDYIYTMQGWIKAVNLPGEGSAKFEPGKDGHTEGVNRYVAQDEMSYVLGYNKEDYTPIDNSLLILAPAASQGLGKMTLTLWNQLSSDVLQKGTVPGLFNGNIAAMITSIRKMKDYKANPTALYEGQRMGVATAYQYDALHRIRKSLDYRFDGDDGQGAGGWSGVSTGLGLTGDNHTEYTYDGNGNITTLKRWNNGRAIDDVVYNYSKTTGKLNHNKLESVDDSKADIIEDNKLIGELSAGNHPFVYDAIGNLTSNTKDGIANVEWTVYGKISKVTRVDGKVIDYTYDAGGNRLTKTSEGKTTVYVRDAQGSVLSVYKRETPTTGYSQKEVYLYGTSRLGQYNFDTERDLSMAVSSTLQGTRGKKFFELSNHLGNVLTVITDQKYWRTEGYYTATVVSATDYYPFGMAITGRKYNPTTYRYGFNGKETDSEWGTEMIQDYGFRIYSPSIAKFLSVDPLTKKYAELTPYQFASNNPILNIDIDGLEGTPSNNGNSAAANFIKGAFDRAEETVDNTIKGAASLVKSVPTATGSLYNFVTDENTYKHPIRTYLNLADRYENFMNNDFANAMTSYSERLVQDGNLILTGNAYQKGYGTFGLGFEIANWAYLGVGLSKLSFGNVWGLNDNFALSYKPKLSMINEPLSDLKFKSVAAKMGEEMGIRGFGVRTGGYIPESQARSLFSLYPDNEFALIYQHNPATNKGSHFLYRGKPRTINIPEPTSNTYLIWHLHPGGTPFASEADYLWLMNQPKQFKSIIYPKDKPKVIFRKTDESLYNPLYIEKLMNDH